MSERKRAKIFPWSMSVTGSWGPETGLYALRDLDADALSDALWEPGIHVQNTAIVELMGHGNPRKAAEVARTLVEKHPVCERSIRENFGEVADYLLKEPLDSMPSSPSEYSPRRIEYIQ